MTLKELENAIKNNAELSLDEIVKVIKNNIEFSFKKDKISIKELLLDEETFKDYIKYRSGSFEENLMEYISEGLNYEYTMDDIINITLK